MPHTLMTFPHLVKHSSTCDSLPRFPVRVARICHDLLKDDSGGLPDTEGLLAAYRSLETPSVWPPALHTRASAPPSRLPGLRACERHALGPVGDPAPA